MRSRYSVLGHPMHPTLVEAPIGLFVWAFASQLIFLTTTTHFWYSMSFWTGIAALSAALIAALPGFGDLRTIGARSAAYRIGVTHMVLNLSLLALFFTAVLLMLNDSATGGAKLIAVGTLQGVGVIMLGISGWLGGEMVYKHHLAVVPLDEQEGQEAEYETYEAGYEPRTGFAPRRRGRGYEQRAERGYQPFRPGIHRRD
ncbi:MAG: DUF2231 domain-containing protein [Dehalococcoidia bacterium]|nr:DUF2231 domain-containing protein [Dehalococcoidia bacterium]